MMTKAAILYEINKPLRIEEIEIPSLRKGQVLVKMEASGICRRQLNEVKGYYGDDLYLPHLLGHEGAGEVVDISEGVTKVKKGDYVVLTWIKGKGWEVPTTTYKLGKKIINAGAVMTFGTYTVVSENRLVKIDKRIPSDVAAILGCAVATGIGIIRQTLDVKKGSTIAILGVGGIGASVILGAKMRKCRQVIAVDVNEDKLKFAKTLGATHTVNFWKDDVYSAIKRISGGNVDYAVEASGAGKAMEAAFEIIKNSGSVVIAGNLKKGEKICLDPFSLICGKKIIGTWGGETDPDRDIPYYANQYLKRNLELDKLITQRFRLEEVNHALELMAKGKSLGRTVIEFL